MEPIDITPHTTVLDTDDQRVLLHDYLVEGHRVEVNYYGAWVHAPGATVAASKYLGRTMRARAGRNADTQAYDGADPELVRRLANAAIDLHVAALPDPRALGYLVEHHPVVVNDQGATVYTPSRVRLGAVDAQGVLVAPLPTTEANGSLVVHLARCALTRYARAARLAGLKP